MAAPAVRGRGAFAPKAVLDGFHESVRDPRVQNSCKRIGSLASVAEIAASYQSAALVSINRLPRPGSSIQLPRIHAGAEICDPPLFRDRFSHNLPLVDVWPAILPSFQRSKYSGRGRPGHGG